MAEAASRSILQAKGFLVNSDNFELDIKKRMSWSLEEWMQEGEEGRYTKTFVNSLKFWSKKLKKAIGPRNVVITLYGVLGDISERLQDIVDAVLSLENNIVLTGFSTFRNTKYLALYFGTEEMKKLVLNKLKIVGQNNVAFLSWALDAPIKNLRVSWVPLDVEISHVRQELEKYFSIIEEKREVRILMGGLVLPSGAISYKALLKQDIDIDKIPHLTEIAEFEALITVQGRQMECLTCSLKGHKSKNCMTPYCTKCNCLMPRIHMCKDENGEKPARVSIGTGEEQKVRKKDDSNALEKLISNENMFDDDTGSDEASIKSEVEGQEPNAAIGMVESYFKELNSFDLPKVHPGEAVSKFIMDSSREIDTIKTDGVVNMQTDDRSFKRKLEKKDKTVAELKSQNTQVKTYDRRGTRSNKSVSSSILFDSVFDKG